jgi:hypothetical protein
VRLSVTEVIAMTGVVLQLVEFQHQYLGLLVDVQCSLRSGSAQVGTVSIRTSSTMAHLLTMRRGAEIVASGVRG